MKSVMQQAKENSKQIFNQNVNAAKTFEQNSKDIVVQHKMQIQDSISP